MLVVERHVVVALVVAKPKIFPAVHGRHIGKRHPDPLLARTHREIIREYLHVLLPRRPKSPTRLESKKHKPELRRGGVCRLLDQPEVVDDQELSSAGVIDQSILGRLPHVKAQGQPGLPVFHASHRIDRKCARGAGPNHHGVDVFTRPLNDPGAANVVVPSPAGGIDRQREGQKDRTIARAR